MCTLRDEEDMMKKIANYLIVGMGCFFGGIVRYFFETLWASNIAKFPIGTFVSDFLGCLIMGLVIGYFSKKKQASAPMKLFLTTGFCGGLTTFSSFILEIVNFIYENKFLEAMYYTISNLFLGLLSVFIGIKLVSNNTI